MPSVATTVPPRLHLGSWWSLNPWSSFFPSCGHPKSNLLCLTVLQKDCINFRGITALLYSQVGCHILLNVFQTGSSSFPSYNRNKINKTKKNFNFTYLNWNKWNIFLKLIRFAIFSVKCPLPLPSTQMFACLLWIVIVSYICVNHFLSLKNVFNFLYFMRLFYYYVKIFKFI